MSKTRKEKDSIGYVEIPSDALFGAQTQRAIENFQLGWPFDFNLVLPYVVIKKLAPKLITHKNELIKILQMLS